MMVLLMTGLVYAQVPAPTPPVAVSPLDEEQVYNGREWNGATWTSTGTQKLEWNRVGGGAVSKYIVRFWTNNLPVTTNLVTASSYPNSTLLDVGDNVVLSNWGVRNGTNSWGYTNYWQVIASNVTGTATSSIFKYYPSRYNKSVYTNMAVYFPFITDSNSVAVDVNPRLGSDNWTKNGEVEVNDYCLSMNKIGKTREGYLKQLLVNNGYQGTYTTYGQLSIGFWVRFNDSLSSQNPIVLLSDSPELWPSNAIVPRTIFKQTSASTSFQVWIKAYMEANSSGATYFQSLISINYAWPVAPLTNTWYHYVATISMPYGVATGKLYINGVLVNTANAAGTMEAYSYFIRPYFKSQLYFGLTENNESYSFQNIEDGRPLVGDVDDFFIADMVLSSNEIYNISTRWRSLNPVYP